MIFNIIVNWSKKFIKFRDENCDKCNKSDVNNLINDLINNKCDKYNKKFDKKCDKRYNKKFDKRYNNKLNNKYNKCDKKFENYVHCVRLNLIKKQIDFQFDC